MNHKTAVAAPPRKESNFFQAFSIKGSKGQVISVPFSVKIGKNGNALLKTLENDNTQLMEFIGNL